jgi:hypothetical protein
VLILSEATPEAARASLCYTCAIQQLLVVWPVLCIYWSKSKQSECATTVVHGLSGCMALVLGPGSLQFLGVSLQALRKLCAEHCTEPAVAAALKCTAGQWECAWESRVSLVGLSCAVLCAGLRRMCTLCKHRSLRSY